VPVAIIVAIAKTLTEPIFVGDFLYIGTKTPPKVGRDVFHKWPITFGIIFSHIVLLLCLKYTLFSKFLEANDTGRKRGDTGV